MKTQTIGKTTPGLRMDVFLEQIINGLTIGAFYAMIALGYSMVYGVMKLINFAHGDFFALGSYFGYSLLVWGSALISNRFGLWGGMVVALVVAGICVALVGMLTERVAYRPIYAAGRLPAVVSALGASILIENAIMAIWGPRYLAYTLNNTLNPRQEYGNVYLSGILLFS